MGVESMACVLEADEREEVLGGVRASEVSRVRVVVHERGVPDIEEERVEERSEGRRGEAEGGAVDDDAGKECEGSERGGADGLRE